MRAPNFALFILCLTVLNSCSKNSNAEKNNSTQNKSKSYVSGDTVKPLIVTDSVIYDTDDPAIYFNRESPESSFIVGTDKNIDGALYAFDLQGKVIDKKVLRNLQRPNNCDVNYGLRYNSTETDIAIVAERITHKIRIIKLPEMETIDGDGIAAFVNDTLEEQRELMGVSSYRDSEGNIQVIIGRKTGPIDGRYLQQYQLKEDSGIVTGELVREFGIFSGLNEIEAIAVDEENGFVYYSDEGVGTRKYYADPKKGNEELALFGQGLFAEDNEGIAIYKTSEKQGMIFISDQAVSKLQVFDRITNQHLGEINYKALETDGIEVINYDFNGKFPGGLLVAMSTDKTFHYYSVSELLSAMVKI